MKKKDWQALSWVLSLFSVLSVILAAWGFLAADVWLASTQWLLVAVIFGLWSVWVKTQ